MADPSDDLDQLLDSKYSYLWLTHIIQVSNIIKILWNRLIYKLVLQLTRTLIKFRRFGWFPEPQSHFFCSKVLPLPFTTPFCVSFDCVYIVSGLFLHVCTFILCLYIFDWLIYVAVRLYNKGLNSNWRPYMYFARTVLRNILFYSTFYLHVIMSCLCLFQKWSPSNFHHILR